MRRSTSVDPKRSALMARVRREGTSAETAVAEALRDRGARYRRNVRSLPGSPDFVNRARGWIVFVHGCFWHQHSGCPRATIPKTNVAFWRRKFADNKIRDARAIRELRGRGFRVAVVWECEAERPERLTRKLSKILEPGGVGVGKAVDHRRVVEDLARRRRRRIVDQADR